MLKSHPPHQIVNKCVKGVNEFVNAFDFTPRYKNNDDALDAFERFLRANLEYMPSSTRRSKQCIAKVLGEIGKPYHEITEEDLQDYFIKIENLAPKTRKNYKIDMRVFFRDFLKRPELIEGIKLPYVPKKIRRDGVSKEDLQAFYSALDNDEERALFLLIATSGIRPIEAFNLKFQDIDIENGFVKPIHDTRTKRAFISCFNDEAKEQLLKIMQNKEQDDLVFTIPRRVVQKRWNKLSKAMGIKITMQGLRQWFSSEMGKLGIPDRYVDAFQGRLPSSVLAEFYTDYEPSKLRVIYEKAGLRVLSSR